jgi:hypothetical protein
LTRAETADGAERGAKESRLAIDRTLVTLAPVRTRIGARQPLTVRVRNRNAFPGNGRLRGAATVRAARIALPARLSQLPQATARAVRVGCPPERGAC